MDESEDQIRDVERSGQHLEQQADKMEGRNRELGSDIDAARQEFQRRRNDSSQPGLPPEPEDERPSEGSDPSPEDSKPG